MTSTHGHSGFTEAGNNSADSMAIAATMPGVVCRGALPFPRRAAKTISHQWEGRIANFFQFVDVALDKLPSFDSNQK
jgi:hypothetical protein